MSAYVDPRFRPTLWPGTVIPAPPLEPFTGVWVEGDWILWKPGPRRGQQPIELPEDFYLREFMDLSADDLEGIAEVFRTYGALFHLSNDDLDLRSHSDEELERIRAIPEAGFDDQPYPFGVHREQVRLHVETAQAAITTWLACQREGGLEELVAPEVTEETLASIQAENAHQNEVWPPSLDYLRNLLIELRVQELKTVLGAALSRFSVGIGGLSDRYPTVHSVAFLQLYNHLAEGAAVRTCANHNCGRDFVRQRGRANYGQHRTTGIKYCSRECARAQAQRDLRRRRRTTEPTA
ncbi:hypothetical protein [Kitasatospora sp. NPDC050543]|uniref:hypothetical protein n=1 Tax=Kitasatospora sp. NPDC050543 TaxID=3364054 RepID=UPI003791A381